MNQLYNETTAEAVTKTAQETMNYLIEALHDAGIDLGDIDSIV